MIDKTSILAENQRRLSEMYSPYDPILGIGSPIERKSLAFTCAGRDVSFNVPLSLYSVFNEIFDVLNNVGSVEACMSILGLKGSANVLLSEILYSRMYHDFEYWAFQCVKIQDKRSKKPIPFRLNRPQRRTLASLEKDRMAGVPIRTIILKARQWGGSTLVQIYMAWLQLLHYENWHSLIVTDVENQARTIRGMYSRLMTHYPAYLGKFKLTPFEGSSKNKIIKEKGCVISIGSVQKPESLRSNDISMCHLSEVAFWKTTQQKSAEDLVQTIRPSIPNEPGTLIVLESTAKGVGSMFHHEWTSAVQGESGYTPVFVPWFEIEMYQEAIGSENVSAFIDKVFSDAYYQFLWDEGASLQGINWYINYKSSENWSDWRMQAEFPTTCIAKGQRIGTNRGLIKIEDITQNDITFHGKVIKHINNGSKTIFELKTKSGYSVQCTGDHLINTNNGWRYLKDIKFDDIISLSPPLFSNAIYNVDVSPMSLIDAHIPITLKMGRFLGIYMGDGSFNTRTLSIACDARDVDFIEDTQTLIESLFNGKARRRLIGKNKGCCEIRLNKISLKLYFDKMGIIRNRSDNHGPIRNVCVPECIWMSPKEVIREFLRGIFETDGTCCFGLPKVELSSMHTAFLKDVQLLLLGFGITSKITTRQAINGNGRKYTENKLKLQGEQADLYYNKIGFLSKRKCSLFDSWAIKSHTKRTKNILEDSVVSIVKIGVSDVFDLTIENEHKFDANGILVHNCTEAFQSTNQRVFAPDYVRNARRACIDPVFIGDVTGASMKGREALQKIEFVRSAKGQLLVWSLPEHEERHNDRYVVSVDIGGRTDKADWSIIRVFDRYWMAEGGYPEAVATWRGHLDQDLVAWKAAQIAKFYNSALLLVESNSLDKDSTDGSHFLTVLDEIAPYYDNLFARNDPEKIRQGLPLKYGFMTSHSTKGMIIDTLNALLRDEAYVERDVRVCDEMDTYEIKPDGTLGAVNGCHDDMVMATAIGVWACVSYLPPFNTKQAVQARRRVIVSEATI